MPGFGPTSPSIGGLWLSGLGGGAGFSGRDLVWADLRFPAGPGVGTEELPFNTANLGLGAMPDGGTLVLAGGDASMEPGVTIGAKSGTYIGFSGQKGSGGLAPVLPTLTYAITTGTQRLAFRNISAALVHSGTTASLTEFDFFFCPTVTLTAGGDAPPVRWVGGPGNTFSGSGGAAQFVGGTIAGYVANGSGTVSAAGSLITSDITSSVSIVLTAGCTFGGALSITAPSISVDAASLYNAVTAGVTFSTTVHLLVPFGTPSDIGTANSTGTATTLLPSDHVHRLTFTTWNAAAAGANAPININGQKITGAGAPTVGSDYVTKTYADAIAVGLKVKTPAVAVATANQATLSGTAQTIDGVALNTIGMRVLLTAQSTATQIGLWVVASGAWTRPADFATGAGAAQSYVLVTGGTSNGGNSYFCTNASGSDVIDTANLTFVLFSQATTVTAHNGLTKTGNQLDVVAGDATIVVSVGSLVVGVIGNANLADNTIALSRLVNAGAQGDFLARNSAGGGAWQDVTATQAKALLGIVPSGTLQPVRAATTASITLSGTQTVDGVALLAGDRCLVKNQGTGSQNGPYLVASGAWTRTTDANTTGQLVGGMLFPISEGTVNGDQTAQLTTNDPITIGTTALTFTMGRVATIGSAAPLDVTDGAAQVGTTTGLAAPIDHVHHLGVATVVTLLALAASSISVNSQKITSLANGTVSTDAVNLGQVTSAISTALTGLTAPINGTDDHKVAYANAGNLAYASWLTTTSTALTFTQAPVSGVAPPVALTVTGGAHTSLTASTEPRDITFALDRTVQLAAGALTAARAARFQAPTYAFTGPSTITQASTVAISGAPIAGTSATIPSSLALLIESGAIGLSGASAGSTDLARSGALRTTGSPNVIIGSRNYDDSGDVSALKVSGDGSTFADIRLGDDGAKGHNSLYLQSKSQIVVQLATVQKYTFSSTALTTPANLLMTAGFAAFGGSAANSGDIRGSYGFAIKANNHTGLTTPFNLISGAQVFGVDDSVLIGDTTANKVECWTGSGGTYAWRINGNVEYNADATAFTMNDNNLLMGAGFISSGSNPAGQGAIRLTASAGVGGIWFQNNAHAADIAALFSGTDDVLYLGDATNSVGVNLRSQTAGFVQAIFGANTPLSIHQSTFAWTPVAATSGTAPVALTITGAAHTGLTASTEPRDINFSLNRVVTMATGALTSSRSVYFNAPTYAFAGPSTVTQASTVAISGAPAAFTNATFTRRYALLIENNGIAFGSNPHASTTALINATYSGGQTIVGITSSGGSNRSVLTYTAGDVSTLGSTSAASAVAGQGGTWNFAATATFPGVDHNIAAGGDISFGTAPTSALLNFPNPATIAAGFDSGATARNLLGWTSANHLTLGSGNISVDVIAQGNTWAFGATAAFAGVELNLATGGFVSFTGTHAGSGDIRGGTAFSIVGRTGGGNDVSLAALASNILTVGDAVRADELRLKTNAQISFMPSGLAVASVSMVSGTVDLTTNKLKIDNVGSVPSAPGSGGYLYADGGALKWISFNGNRTTIAPA